MPLRVKLSASNNNLIQLLLVPLFEVPGLYFFRDAARYIVLLLMSFSPDVNLAVFQGLEPLEPGQF
jgi:hypothetical protein